MNKYRVEINVVSVATATVEVEARDAGKALKLADDLLYNSELEWSFELDTSLPPKMSVEPVNA